MAAEPIVPLDIAILADIHGNLFALEAVLDDITGQGVDDVLVAGDLVGRGPQGSAVVRRIRELGLPAIVGNHEDYLLEFRHGRVPDEWWVSDEWAAVRWMAAELDDADVAFLEALPFSLSRPDLKLVHGTPRTNRAGIGSWTAEEDLRAFQAEIAENVLVCAHTHRPLIRETEAGLVVNVGSVGLPFNRDRRAQYAILRRGGRWGWQAELRQVDYDRAQMFETYASSGFLAAGGVTARLLRLELEHAAPFLVPFVQWTRASGVEASASHLDAFLRFHPPGTSLRVFMERLRRLAEA